MSPGRIPAAPCSSFIKVKGESGTEKAVKLYSESYALVIGAWNYQDKDWPKLPGVVKDILDIEKVLKEQGFQVTILKNPDKSHLLSGIDDFINNYGFDPENRLLIYFAGHGYTAKLPTGVEMGYIVPADAPSPNRDKKGFFAKAVDMLKFESYAKTILSKHALFVFDSCFSGSLFDTT